MGKNIKKAKQKRFKKVLSLAVGAMILSGQAVPVMALAAQSPQDSSRLMSPAAPEDLNKLQSCLSQSGVESFVPENLIMKGFKLTNYEMLIMSELIKRDIQKSGDGEEKYRALNNLVDLQKKYSDEYQMIFNTLPKEIQREAKEVEKGQKVTAPLSGKFELNPETAAMANMATAGGGAEKTAEQVQVQSTEFSPSTDEIQQLAQKYGIALADPDKAASDVAAYQNGVEGAASAQGLSDAMSLINIRHSPAPENKDYNYTNPLNPVLEINTEGVDLGEPDLEADISTEDDRYRLRSIQEIIDEAANIQDKKAKHFFLSLAHSLYYMDSGTEGAQKLNTAIRDDNGNLYEVATPDEHELQQTLEIGLGIRVHKALDLLVSMIAKNEDGYLNDTGTEWEFGNVLFKFHPERLDKAGLKRLNSEGIIIRDGGRIVGKQIGHSSEIVTDTEDGNTQLKVGSALLNYDKDEGIQFSNEDSRYYIGFGKMSLNLSTYTLQLSDCKAVKVGYHDNDQELMLLYSRAKDGTDGFTDSEGVSYPGSYNKDVFAAQYIAKNLIPSMTLTFNFAKGMDKGELSNPNGAEKRRDSVYSMMVQGGTGQTSYEGEFAHINNSYRTSNGVTVKDSANADYLDISHQFSDRLTAQLHLINIDGNYDASSLVEDKTGEYLKTTTKGDGTPDYLYQPGQRGLDLTMNYTLDNSASFAAGYTRYKETEEGNSKTEFYLSGNKQWSLGESGTVSLQQRFGYNKVSNRTEVNKSSDTTLSYSGSLWKDGSISADYQRTINKESGNQTRYDLTVAHDFKPVERVTITPKVQYERKKGDEGYASTSAPMDTTNIINSLTVGYELIPDELTVNFLVSKEKYNVIASEIDEATGKKIDGERRNTLGVGMGLVWEPAKIKGLSLGVSYRRDRIDYLDRQDNSHQDVWEYSVEYSRPISDKIRASISYDYKSAKDKLKPIYDDVTRNISIDIDARIGRHSSIQLQHSYESEYKPLDSNATSTTHTTTFQMVNRF